MAPHRPNLDALTPWERTVRMLLLGLLFFTALEMLMLAAIFGLLGEGEDARLSTAGCLLFGGTAFAFGLGFRRVSLPSWRHWTIAWILALPGALTILLQ